MKISTTNLRRKDGTKLVNGYKISLQKSEVESIGMHDGTELVPFFEDGKIILLEAERLFVSRIVSGKKENESFLECFKYIRLGNNIYNELTFQFKMPAEISIKILEMFPKKPLPKSMLAENEKNGMPQIIWNGKKYQAN